MLHDVVKSVQVEVGKQLTCDVAYWKSLVITEEALPCWYQIPVRERTQPVCILRHIGKDDDRQQIAQNLFVRALVDVVNNKEHVR